MYYIKKKDVILLWIISGVFLLSLNLGILVRRFFLIIAIVTVILYLYISNRKLKCPYCGGKENLDRITFAINHLYHCRHCGKTIEVK